jgi:2-methylaconitate cis-trans-isomerase PrpF
MCDYARWDQQGSFFHESELPSDPELRDKVVLDVFGSPDIR